MRLILASVWLFQQGRGATAEILAPGSLKRQTPRERGSGPRLGTGARKPGSWQLATPGGGWMHSSPTGETPAWENTCHREIAS